MMQYLRENDTCKITFYDGKALSMELPQTVTLKVVETEPGIKGATAAAQTKPATLETGLIVQVPSFIAEGELIVIQTEDGKYLRRAKEREVTRKPTRGGGWAFFRAPDVRSTTSRDRDRRHRDDTGAVPRAGAADRERREQVQLHAAVRRALEP